MSGKEDDVKPGDNRLKASKNVNSSIQAKWKKLSTMGSAYASSHREQKGDEAYHWSVGAPDSIDKKYLEWEETDLLVFS